MKILCVFGKYNYGDSSRGIGYEYANFIPAFRSLGHEVIFFESLDKSAYKNYIELNRSLLDTVNSENPDIIFCVLMGYEIWLETLEIIREYTKATLIHWATDDSWKYDQFSRFIAPVFDVYATTYPSAIHKAEKDGHRNFILSQWAANSSNFNSPCSFQDCLYDVTFIGTMYGNRKKWIRKLASCGIRVECFGHGWSNGSISDEKIPQIINKSRISLNFGDSGLVLKDWKLQRNRQIKARVFEVPGAGGLLMTESAEHLEEFYTNGEEIVIFNGIDDLVNKVRCLLDNPDNRDLIAKSAFDRTIQEHSYEHRFENLIGKAIKNKIIRENIPNNVSMYQFERMAHAHKIGVDLILFKVLILFPCILIWGKNRGPRAARRLLFEISWRVFGRKTYSVAGLPGRLFYKAS